jgi:hypothetical protein
MYNSNAKLYVENCLREFCCLVGLPESNDDDDNFTNKYIFSLTKLLGHTTQEGSCSSRGSQEEGGEGAGQDCSNNLVSPPSPPTLLLPEVCIAASLRDLLPPDIIERMQKTPYVLKRRMVRVAHRLWRESLLEDGTRLNEAARAGRYVELVCFLLDTDMLGDVAALRMTCKSNDERRRFPVCGRGGEYCELEGNIVEEWLGRGCSSRFVSTGVVEAVRRMHHREWISRIGRLCME